MAWVETASQGMHTRIGLPRVDREQNLRVRHGHRFYARTSSMAECGSTTASVRCFQGIRAEALFDRTGRANLAIYRRRLATGRRPAPFARSLRLNIEGDGPEIVHSQWQSLQRTLTVKVLSSVSTLIGLPFIDLQARQAIGNFQSFGFIVAPFFDEREISSESGKRGLSTCLHFVRQTRPTDCRQRARAIWVSNPNHAAAGITEMIG
jgi:hypothetical protein